MTYSIEEAKQFVIKAGLELSEAGLVARTWGNISARISDHQFVITPSGRAYDTLTLDDIVVVNIEDGSYEGKVKPSGEKGVHAVVYQMRPQMNFVIHTHQNYASALSILGEIIPVSEDKHRLLLSDEIPCAEYGMYATKRLVNAIAEQMQEHERSKAILMKYHGAVCMGKDYEEAFSVAYALEETCKKEYENRCRSKKGIQVDLTDSGKQAGNVKKDLQIENSNEDNAKPYEIDENLRAVIKRQFGINEAICVRTPYIMAVSRIGKKQRPYLDDAAQIAGVDVACISETADTGKLLKALEKRNAVLIKNVGAVCTGMDESEAEAVGIVLEKNCMASYLAYKNRKNKKGKIPPLPRFSAWKDRKGYISHYSKLK